MNSVLHTETVGQRVYVVGDSYAVRDRLKALGCHWDPDRKQWWIGRAKESGLAAVLRAGAAQAPPEDLDRARVYARVDYRGRSYYQRAATRDGARLRLVTLDGKADFWADARECRALKTYPPRVWRGRTEYTTLGGLRRFVERARADDELARTKSPAELKALGWCECWECGRLCPPDRLDSSGYCGC